MGCIVNLQWFYSDFTMQHFAEASHTLTCRRVVLNSDRIKLSVLRESGATSANKIGLQITREKYQTLTSKFRELETSKYYVHTYYIVLPYTVLFRAKFTIYYNHYRIVLFRAERGEDIYYILISFS